MPGFYLKKYGMLNIAVENGNLKDEEIIASKSKIIYFFK